MSREELANLQLVALQFHLVVCTKIGPCGRCRAALEAQKFLNNIPVVREAPNGPPL
jgi:hypothetical protein